MKKPGAQSTRAKSTREKQDGTPIASTGTPGPADDSALVRGIVDSITEPLVVYDGEWRARYVNDAALKIFRLSGRDSFIGRVLWDEYPDLVGTGFEREMRRAAETRQPTSFTEFRPASGVWVDVRCHPLPDGGIVAVWKDITNQKQSEETLHYLSRVSEILAESLDYESTLTAVARLVVPELADYATVHLVNDRGVVQQLALAHVDPDKVRWAAQLNERYPTDPNSPTGVPQVIRSGKAELYPEITDEMLTASTADPEHLALLKQIGITSALLVPLEAHGRVFGALSLISSESKRRYTQRELTLAQEIAHRAALAVDNARLYRDAVKARSEAEDANMAKTTFLARMSHELRTPLNAIGGYAELLATGVRGPMTDAQKNDLQRIQRNQRHLLALINDVLNFAKLEVGRVAFDIQAVAISTALADLDMLFAGQLQERGLRFSAAPVDPSVKVSADPEKLQQILLNLVSNAVKFTAADGEIEIAVESAQDVVRISVRDTGSGIPKEKLDSIFQPFVQIPRVGAVAEGTGLGLAISRDLARYMGGDLTVESAPDAGSTFTLVLPRA